MTQGVKPSQKQIEGCRRERRKQHIKNGEWVPQKFNGSWMMTWKDLWPFIAAFIIAIVGSFFISCNAQVKEQKHKMPALYETVHTDQEWKEILTPMEYHVLREAGTERAFSHHLNNEKRDGYYTCAADSTILFTSPYKFNSGTGWPSFSSAQNVEYEWDGRATEIRCITCGSHLGHLFKDGEFTNSHNENRYCINGTALKFHSTEGSNGQE